MIIESRNLNSHIDLEQVKVGRINKPCKAECSGCQYLILIVLQQKSGDAFFQIALFKKKTKKKQEHVEHNFCVTSWNNEV